jgi:SAM-dependent methyltransferase
MHYPNVIGRVFGRIRTGRFDTLWYAVWTRIKGLDLGVATVGDLGLSPDRSKDHASSGGPDLTRVLKKIRIGNANKALDLGSGKGGAVFTLAKFPFDEVVGVEISEKLVHIAEANAARLKLKHIRFLCGDAGEFRDLDRFTHIYMFNSFPVKVTREVMTNMEASLIRKPRTLFLIIKGPDSLENIINSKLFRKVFAIQFLYSQPFYVYLHESANK